MIRPSPLEQVHVESDTPKPAPIVRPMIFGIFRRVLFKWLIWLLIGGAMASAGNRWRIMTKGSVACGAGG